MDHKLDDSFFPRNLESSAWDHRKRGRKPLFWKYIKHSACHFIVNTILEFAIRVDSKIEWCIITSSKHSAVWDGDATIMDFNYFGMGVPVETAWESLHCEGHYVLPPGVHVKLGYSE